jgi:uncharacterized protein (TIGR03435 family)
MQASFICAALLLSIPCSGYAQTQAAKSAFDVASIKPMEEPVAGFGMGPGAAAGRPFIPAMGLFMGKLEFRPGNVGTSPIGITAGKVILEAYRLKPEQISGGPDWLFFDRFQLQAKAEGADEERLRLMLQTLLAERFHMVTHRETRRMPVYFLVPAKGGPKLKEIHQSRAQWQNLGAGELTEVTALGAYARARTSLDQVIGETLEKNNILLEEGISGHVAGPAPALAPTLFEPAIRGFRYLPRGDRKVAPQSEFAGSNRRSLHQESRHRRPYSSGASTSIHSAT